MIHPARSRVAAARAFPFLRSALLALLACLVPIALADDPPPADPPTAHDHHDGDHEHDHDAMSDEHEHDAMAGSDERPAFNAVAWGDATVRLWPLVGDGGAHGVLAIGLGADVRPERVALLAPDGGVVAEVRGAVPNADGVWLLHWFDDPAATGVWRLRIDGAAGPLEVPLALERTRSDAGTEVALALAPAPSLDGRGRSEAFVYVFRDGEPVHAGMTLRRAMTGMVHSTDEEDLVLVHEHFPELPASGLDAMANRSPISFAMAGRWTVGLAIGGERPETVTLEAEVLAQ